MLNDMPDVIHCYSYFPIIIDEKLYGKSRDELYEKLKENNIFTRRYFYPLISDFEPYRELTSAQPDNLVIAKKTAKQVLCLPIYVELTFLDVENITKIISL
jgi:dTDP-4-amino-4,6-dideoxygalactose transaminase